METDGIAKLPAFQLIAQLHKTIISIINKQRIMVNLHVHSVVSGFLGSCEGIICVSTVSMHYVILTGAVQKTASNRPQTQMSLHITKPRNETLGVSIAQT